MFYVTCMFQLFASTPRLKTNSDMYKYPVFNLNPRLCLGKTAAMMQAKAMAISILRKYEIIPIPNQDPDIAYHQY